MRLTAKTDTGKTRLDNQDDYRASIQGEGNAWMVVCDGMGGANGGSTASGLAVGLVEERCTVLELAECDPDETLQLAGQMVQEANTLVYETSLGDAALRGMGTTMVLALVTKGELCLASVGDSRAYLYRQGQLRQLTRDHSMVQELVEKGVITQQEANTHPQKNVITRAVGIQPQVEADLIRQPLQPQDMVLLCTDGLTNAVSLTTIEGILQSGSFYENAGQLVEQVLCKEEQDNTTVLLLSLS